MERREIEYNSTNIESFSFQLSSADLHIEQYDGSSIVIETDAILNKDFEILQKPDKIELIEKKRSFINYSFFNAKNFNIKIPVSISLFISIASGDLFIENKSSKYEVNKYNSNLNADIITSTIDVRLTSGDFSAQSLSTKVFIFSSTSSDLILNNSKLGKTKIKGISSDISLKNCYIDEIDLKTISGDMYLELLSFNKIMADLKSGDIKIICPKTKVNGEFNTLSGDINIDGVEIDKSVSVPNITARTLSGDIYIKGKFTASEKVFSYSSIQPIKSAFEESSKKDEREKFIQLLLDGKIAEKDAVELLKNFGFTDSEIDSIFEEYLFRKINRGEGNE